MTMDVLMMEMEVKKEKRVFGHCAAGQLYFLKEVVIVNSQVNHILLRKEGYYFRK
jgi:hypothetical protein